MIDRGRMQQNLDWILAQVEDLESERERPGFWGEFAARDLVAAGVRHKLLTAVQAMIDTVYHVAGKRLKAAPSGAGHALDLLVAAGVLPADHQEVWRRMFGFRNRLVHEYQVIDPEVIEGLLRDNLDDFRAFVRAIWVALPELAKGENEGKEPEDDEGSPVGAD